MPRVAAPSRKVTDPVGVPPTTVAVNVTVVPATTGLADDVSVVVVAVPVTVWATADEALALNCSVGTKVAVNEWLPAIKALVVKSAWLVDRATVPKTVPESLKVTDPLGVNPAVTVAVSVIAAPAADGEVGDTASAVLVATPETTCVMMLERTGA